MATAGSGQAKKFGEAYEEICKKLNVPLAKLCPKREKAFGPGTTGTVLGVHFDTEQLNWGWAVDKMESATGLIDGLCKMRLLVI